MKALVQTGPKALEIRDVPAPVSDVIEVSFCGICGSDMHAWGGHDPRRPTPLTLGHEISGRDAGGRRVTVNPLNSCGTCVYCLSGRENICEDRQILSMPPREGGFAEAVAAPADRVVEIPVGVSFEAAALAEPLACGWHATRLARRAAPLTDALVLGGGAIGLGAALSLVAQGAEAVTVVESNPDRADRVRGLPGITVTDTPVAAGTVIDAVGIDATREAAFAHIRPGGVIAHIGLGPGSGGLDPRYATLQEVTFIGTYTYTMEDFRDTAEAIFDGRLPVGDHLDRLIEVHPLGDGAALFDALAAGAVAAPKILLRP